MAQYDVIIIGGGISGLMAGYRLAENNKKVLLIEKGNHITKRKCPSKGKCIQCKSCAITQGLSGAGAFSDGKYIFSSSYGGQLGDYIGNGLTEQLAHEGYEILKQFGADSPIYQTDPMLQQLCLQNDLILVKGELVHFGTDNNLAIMTKFIEYLETKIEIHTNEEVLDFNYHSGGGVKTDKSLYSCDNIIVAVGRNGNEFIEKWCMTNNIETLNNQVDIGVRVEMPALIWKHFSDKIYEPKILYRTKQYGDNTRMFCFNSGSAHVVIENNDGIVTVNGHSNSGNIEDTGNCNFAVLSTIRFTDPFHSPVQYCKHIASLANMVSGGSVLVQRFVDLIDGRRTTEKRLAQSTVRPTLNAVAGDLSLVLPKRQLDNIIETLYQFDKIAKGCANQDTLLYGIECKYYSARPVMDENFQIKEHIYAIGDGAGITRGLGQAAAHGLYVGERII
jgi:hypothetical protein